MKFELNALEMERYARFMRHRCPRASRQWGDSRKYNPTPSLVFTPTAIGDAVELVCPCGRKADITDYASW